MKFYGMGHTWVIKADASQTDDKSLDQRNAAKEGQIHLKSYSILNMVNIKT